MKKQTEPNTTLIADATEINNRFLTALNDYVAADKALEGYYRPLIEDAISRNDFAGAKEIAQQCPRSSVHYHGLADTIRDAIVKAYKPGKQRVGAPGKIPVKPG